MIVSRTKPLCKMYYDQDCKGCPLKKDKVYCEGTDKNTKTQMYACGRRRVICSDERLILEE